MGCRRLWALVRGLPDDAVVWREEHEQAQQWTTQDELGALLIEVTDMWGRAIAQPHYKRGSLPRPIRIPRPGDGPPQRKQIESDPKKIAAFFAEHFKS